MLDCSIFNIFILKRNKAAPLVKNKTNINSSNNVTVDLAYISTLQSIVHLCVNMFTKDM